MKVLVGLSGGVDSAVAAYILKQAGHEVTCCFMRNWDSVLNNDTLGNDTLMNDVCPQEEDYNDAKAVADQLGLKLLRSDYIQEYWEEVFKSFIKEYAKGRTPNPDILCNKYIKFDHFLTFAKQQGFEKIATGHYFKSVFDNNDYHYYKAADLSKDQSYFLAQVKKKALDMTLFPLGDLPKTEVRKIAADLNLKIADKKDSTGICFIGERHFREFLSNYIPMKEGKIIDIDTLEEIGTHNGVYYYTIGQRKGFGVGGNRGPYYCVGKDVRNNILYLTSIMNEHYLESDSALITDINWISQTAAEEDLQAKFRYRQNDNEIHLKKIDEHSAILIYPQKVKAVTPGQQAVFYRNGELLGGGTIEKTYLNGTDVQEILFNRVNHGR
ncbi:MAG: tRNA 2-thiouridine(34) synthase MnmA [Erysipelotrichaceae bacterium]|nr:tRNA 2-thiouridine(34) synthase MnmA [Erysipelotrichaceae bacterium]